MNLKEGAEKVFRGLSYADDLTIVNFKEENLRLIESALRQVAEMAVEIAKGHCAGPRSINHYEQCHTFIVEAIRKEFGLDKS